MNNKNKIIAFGNWLKQQNGFVVSPPWKIEHDFRSIVFDFIIIFMHTRSARLEIDIKKRKNYHDYYYDLDIRNFIFK